MANNNVNMYSTPDVKVAPENVIVLHVDNLLAGWPTYVIRCFPDQPGPVKIILRLKDVKKRVVTDSDSDDLDDDHKPLKKRAKKDIDTSGADIKIMLDASNADPYPNHWDEISEGSEAESSTTSSDVDAIPVKLCGILKDPPPVKQINFLKDRIEYWPPHRPRPYREVTNQRATDAHKCLWTIPAAVRGEEVSDGKENTL